VEISCGAENRQERTFFSSWNLLEAAYIKLICFTL
jgi:hypothetical protein